MRRFSKPPPDPSWIGQIQLSDEVSSQTGIMCAEDVKIPPKGQRLLKLELRSALLEICVSEQDVFKEKSIIVPHSLMTVNQAESVLVINLANTETAIKKGEVFAKIYTSQGRATIRNVWSVLERDDEIYESSVPLGVSRATTW